MTPQPFIPLPFLPHHLTGFIQKPGVQEDVEVIHPGQTASTHKDLMQQKVENGQTEEAHGFQQISRKMSWTLSSSVLLSELGVMVTLLTLGAL